MSKKSESITPGSAAWEALCERCGRCCFEKIEYNERIFFTKNPCQHLDRQQNRCLVYSRRDRLQPDCVRLSPEVVRAGVLPEDCPYVRYVAEHLPVKENPG